MNPLAIFSVSLVSCLLSLVTAIVQALTLRCVRSASRDHDQEFKSPSQGPVRDSPIEASTCGGDVATKAQAREVKSTVSDPQWQWVSYDWFEGENGETRVQRCDESRDSAGSDEGPFQVYNLKRMHTLWPDAVQVAVTSPPLIGILQEYLPDHGDLKSLTEPKIDGRDLYVVLPSLKRHALESRAKFSSNGNLELDNREFAPNGLQPADGARENPGAELGEGGTKELRTGDESAFGILHLRHLVRFLEKEYKDVLKRESRMRDEQRVSWDMLWTFLSKDVKVGYRCDQSGELLCATVADAHYDYNSQLKSGSLRVELDVWDFDGTRYTPCKEFRDIGMFHQERQFSQLAVCPIEILGDPSGLNDKFLANGRRFYELAMKSPNRFMSYVGPMYQRRQYGGCWQLHKERGDGRVLIDLSSFATMNADYPMGNARPAASTQGDEFRQSRSSRRSPFGMNWPPFGMHCPPVSQPAFQSGNIDSNLEEDVSDDNLIFAPAIVYGFSFKLKKWGCFAVSRFSDVVFDREAFQELTMDPEMKSLVYDLVAQYVSSDSNPTESDERVDPIAEKGEGCILLCHGPPGTGKTLTAESIAENMERPLWALSVTELGDNTYELEEKLLKILDIAAKWKAVLLLDEADIYLEKRTSGDVYRNSMTGVFLRTLEYYRGILFLSTNRIGTVDDAFRSRISLFLHYEKLGFEKKAKVWRTLLRRAKVDGVTDEFCEEMAGQNLNGREIRNAIHTAQVWAKRKKEGVAARHVKYVMGVLAKSFSALSQETPDKDIEFTEHTE